MLRLLVNHLHPVNSTAGLFCLAFVVLCCGHPAGAEDQKTRRPATVQRVALKVHEIEPATSSNDARNTVTAGIPLDQLEDHHRAEVETLLGQQTLFRCLPALRIELEPSSYEYYRRHPEVAVAVWKVLGISQLQLMSTSAPGLFSVKSTDGSDGTLEVLLQTDNLLIVRGTGNWHSGVLPTPIRSEGLVVLRHRFEKDREGRRYVSHQAAVFLTFPQQSVRNVARIVSPVTNMIADRNFKDISLFLRMMHVAAIERPGWIEMIAGRLEGLTRPQRDEFLKSAARALVANRRLREASLQR